MSLPHLFGCFVSQISVIKPTWPCAGRRIHLARWPLQGPNVCTKRTIKSTPCRVRLDKRWCNYCTTRIPCDRRLRHCDVANPFIWAKKTIWGQQRVLKRSCCQFPPPSLGTERRNESNSHTRDTIMISEM